MRLRISEVERRRLVQSEILRVLPLTMILVYSDYLEKDEGEKSYIDEDHGPDGDIVSAAVRVVACA